MRASSNDTVQQMYDDTAESYAKVMDAEIALPVYAEVLGRLKQRIEELPGIVVDTACGPGHMLLMYREQFDQTHPLVGVDLSPRMVALAAEKLGASARTVAGDMKELSFLDAASCSAVISFYALHHLDEDGAQQALKEWARVLAPGGQLLLATWEGAGAIDYGEAADIVAFRYGVDSVRAWAQEAGLSISHCALLPVDDFPMDAVLLEASKPAN